MYDIEITKGETKNIGAYEKKSRYIIKTIMAEKINKTFIKKYKTKFIIPNNQS